MWKALRCAAMLLAAAQPAAAQEAGWHYSPYDGEGDRAALGCAYGADAVRFSCLAVRCEDDKTVGVHIHTSRRGGDAGKWLLQIDEAIFELTAEAEAGSVYRARVAGEVGLLLEAIRNGAVAYLDPKTGAQVERNGISLFGSLYAINQALYFCAPVAPSPDQSAPAARSAPGPT